MNDTHSDPERPDAPDAGTGRDAVAGAPAGGEPAVVLRTKDGWRVGGAEVPDLTSAMVLADLLSSELADQQAAESEPGGPPPGEGPAVPSRPNASPARSGAAERPPASDPGRLRATIGQLEHALTARVRVEQAIGVLAERHRIQPRQAFEQLRNAARSRGKRVIDIASDVVASATNPLLQLPDELSRPRSARRGRHPRRALGSE